MAMLQLVVETGEPKGAVFTLRQGRNTVGRSGQSDFRLKDSSISRVHIEVEVTGDSATVKDCSKYGTELDDDPIKGIGPTPLAALSSRVVPSTEDKRRRSAGL
jgi:pSer/pThr/pTyr-binding forkhead associated (FHA) protein